MQLRRSVFSHRIGTSRPAYAICVAAALAIVPLGPFGSNAMERLDPPLKIVAFGTSLTALGGWQDALRARLETCLERGVQIVTVAQVGATSEWALAQAADVVRRRPDIVLVEFAINDASLRHWLSLARSRANIEEVLSRLREISPAPRVFVLAMNPVHGLRGWLRPRLSTFTAEHARAAIGMGAEFVDFRPFWHATSLADTIPDGVHPVASAAIDAIVPELVRRISNGACSQRAR